MVPPMVLYKSGSGNFYRTWGEGGPEGALFTANESGYFTNDKFTQWLVEVRNKRPFASIFSMVNNVGLWGIITAYRSILYR